jgi:hypothetical protein
MSHWTLCYNSNCGNANYQALSSKLRGGDGKIQKRIYTLVSAVHLHSKLEACHLQTTGPRRIPSAERYHLIPKGRTFRFWKIKLFTVQNVSLQFQNFAPVCTMRACGRWRVE